MKVHYLLYLFVSCIIYTTNGQQEANHWYFGHGAGLDFTNGQLSLDPSSNIRANHGSTVISDDQGNLQFYSDGLHVWNKEHEIMPNGLLSDSCVGLFTMQNCIIVPKVDPIQLVRSSDKKYYLFTVQPVFTGNRGLFYYVVDMSLDNGLGDILGAPTNVVDSLWPGCIVTKHANGIDYWLVTQRLKKSNDQHLENFLIYLIDETGINLVNSYVGGERSNASTNQTGCFSPNGKLIFSGNSLLNFDNSTGGVISRRTFGSRNIGYSNGAFSPNNDVLYSFNFGSTSFSLNQYDLTVSDLENTEIEIDVETDGEKKIKGGMQLAPDGKIYISYMTDIGVINNPNVIGVGCNLEQNSINVPGAARWCFPSFSSHYFKSIHSKSNEYSEVQHFVNVSPNPFLDVIYLKTDSKEYNYKVFDLTGRMLKYERVFGNNQLNLDYLTSGVYILEIWIDNQRRQLTKLIKS